MTVARLAKVLGVLVVLVPVLAGCGNGEVVEAGDVTVLVGERSGDAMDMAGGGRIEVTGGCLGTSRYVVVWPHGTEVVDEDPLTIDIPDLGTFEIGDDVELGGGMVLEHADSNVEPGDVEVAGITVPAACAEHDVFLANSEL